MSLVLLADSITSIFTPQALYVVAALVVIEGLLSVDNALAIAAMASHLDEKKRKVAMTIGYAGAYGFRILALFLAGVIIDNHWLMALGAVYLIWLMCDHFSESQAAEEHGEDGKKVPHSFARTIAMIAFLDLSLSFDNVVAAVAFARDNIYLVYLGVTIGIITLRLVAGYCIKLLGKHPWLEHTAFLLVGFVGLLLTVELNWDIFMERELKWWGYPLIHEDDGHYHFQKPVKFAGIFAIILGHLAYENIPLVRTVLQPFTRPVKQLLAAIARAVNLLFMILTWPIRRAYGAFKSA